MEDSRAALQVVRVRVRVRRQKAALADADNAKLFKCSCFDRGSVVGCRWVVLHHVTAYYIRQDGCGGGRRLMV